MANKFDSFSITHFAKDVWIEVVEQKSTDMVAAPVNEVNTWMNPIINYLKDGTLPIDGVAAKKILMKAPMYIICDNVLYKKSFLGLLLRCVGPQEAETVIREVHEGTCGMHSQFRTVVGKIMRMDGRHLVVAVDFFTKWVEAKPLRSITRKQIVNFVWEEIVCHFGVPNKIISDNGKQFAHDLFRAWCDRLNIKQSFSSVAHPQANGQVEVTTGTLSPTSKLGWVRTVKAGFTNCQWFCGCFALPLR
ncbi:uncharacterized protein [Rutidosis leptorrhynchoides]|uniref:uncharacterized protein n=1 Tax=Rutidosis leptorrhynchoides TaxID=125765 RepID=UPI003A9A32C0